MVAPGVERWLDTEPEIVLGFTSNPKPVFAAWMTAESVSGQDQFTDDNRPDCGHG